MFRPVALLLAGCTILHTETGVSVIKNGCKRDYVGRVGAFNDKGEVVIDGVPVEMQDERLVARGPAEQMVIGRARRGKGYTT